MTQVKQFAPWLTSAEYEALALCFSRNWITEGPEARAFEQELLKFIGAPFGVFAPNGTLALFLGMLALGIRPGDEVLVPDFTFIASATAVHMTGATLVFVDVDPVQFQIDLEQAQKKLTARTKAIMPVHIYGAAVDMHAVLDFANRHKLLIIEDAAQTIGVRRNGQHCGTVGHIGCFSFFADKSLTTGEGGFVTTFDPHVYERLRYLRNQGRLDRGPYVHPEIGYNFRITDLQAAIGRVQLRRQPEIVTMKLRVLERYRQRLGHLPLRIMGADEDTTFIPMRVNVLVDDARKAIACLGEHGVEARTFYYPLHKQPCFVSLGYSDTDYPVANHAYDHGVCLPSQATLRDEEVDYVCDVLETYYERALR